MSSLVMADSVDVDFESEFGGVDGFKDLHCLQQQNVGKLSRSDLEDLYYQLHDENIQVKKKFNTLDSKYKLMAGRVMRLSRDHKCINSVTREEEQNQLRQLKQSEASLKAKLAVLRGQLASHTRLHSAALSKPVRPRSHRCSRGCHPSSCSGDDLPPDSGRASCYNHQQVRNRSTSRSGSRSHSCGGASDKEQDESVLSKRELQQQIASLQERVAVLQKDMELASNQSHHRIIELETELATRLSSEVGENVELIRARRACKQHEASLITLQQEYQAVQSELQATKGALEIAARDQDEVCKALTREKQRSANLQQEIIMLSHNSSSLRELKEQLNDLKKENSVLKAHSNQLLQLTTGNTDGLRGAGEGSREEKKDALDVHQKLQKETGTLQEECEKLQLKVATLHKEQAQIQQKLISTSSEITQLQKQLLEAHDERNQLLKQLSEARSECANLQQELLKPSEERNRLKQQLSDIQNECVQLEAEVEKMKLNLQHLQQSVPSLQERSSLRIGNSTTEHGTRPEPSPRQFSAHNSLPMQQALYSTSQPLKLQNPQQWPFYSKHYATPLTAHLQTGTPRKGDACLALLEQTAIRSPVDAVLSTHGSLQERFLELCVSTASPTIPSTPLGTPAPSASSTPLPTVTPGQLPVREKQPFLQGSEPEMGNTPQQVLGLKAERSPGRALGEADAAWELDRCRELLRVQCNLNSMYKKEVTSLNHIVKTLTTRPSSTER